MRGGALSTGTVHPFVSVYWSHVQQRPAFRILALDVGRKRIGLAITDEMRITVRGLDTLERVKPRVDLARITDIVKTNDVGLLLVGLPVRLGGEDSAMTAHVRTFAAALQDKSGKPVQLWDERLTSVAAEARLEAEGLRPMRRTGAIDQAAACILLEDYLATQASLEAPENR